MRKRSLLRGRQRGVWHEEPIFKDASVVPYHWNWPFISLVSFSIKYSPQDGLIVASLHLFQHLPGSHDFLVPSRVIPRFIKEVMGKSRIALIYPRSGPPVRKRRDLVAALKKRVIYLIIIEVNTAL